MPLSFNYQWRSYRLKNKRRITDWILAAAYIEKKEIERLNYVFCTDEYLLRLNREFLSHDTYTDILTFNYSGTKKIEAEIFISMDRVKENAKNLNISFDDELHRVMIHGVLHCMGYTDKSAREQKKMRKKEDECLRLLAEMNG